MKRNFLLSALFFYCFQISYSQSGQLDPSFGNNGIVKTDIGSPFKYSSSARQVFTRPDGSVYIILDATFVTKRLADGSIDSGYGLKGYSKSVLITDAFAAIQPDEKILIAGSIGNGSFGITRINISGLPDSTFGINGLQTVGINPRAVAVQNDGKIVIAGYFTDAQDDTYFSVVRYTGDGNPDNTFNENGQVITDFGFKVAPESEEGDSIEIHKAYANAVAIQADGKIVVGGYVYTGIDNDFAVVRYTTDGRPDSTFHNDGRQSTGIGTSDDVGNSLVIQSDGKIALGGYTTEETTNSFSIVRYNINGSLDDTFSGDGKQTADLGSDAAIGNSVSIQIDDKIVIAGYTLNSTGNNDFAVARFNTNGSPDNSFANDGKLTTDFSTSDDYAGFIAIQTDGKIIVAGYSYTYIPGNTLQNFALTRYNIDGTLDNSFDSDGKLEGDYMQGNTEFNSIAIQADGKPVVCGQTWNGSNYSFTVARYNTNGSPDTTFSDDGKTITSFTGDAYATSIALQSDGKIVVAGNNNNRFRIVRYNTNGNLDNTFSGDGKQTVSFGFADICRSVALQNDGKIVLAGFSFADPNTDSAYFAVARLNSNGNLDNTFSQDGKQLTDFGTYKDFANSVAIQNDGKIVVAGRSYINNNNQFSSLARYNNNGSLDTSFSNDGKQSNSFGADLYFIQDLAIQNDGNIVVAGYSETPSGENAAFVVARYTTNGDLDNTFSDDGFQTTTLGSQIEYGKSLAINADGRIAVGGTNNDFAIALYNSNGSLDNTFSGDGIQTTKPGTGNSSIQSLVFSDNKLYAAGSGEFPGILGVVARYLLPESGPLPVSKLDFKGILQNTSVLLKWKIATEKNVATFVVQRSANANSFIPISNVKAFGVSAVSQDYSSIDEHPLKGINFYRLKIIDVDGKFTYSNSIAVKIKSGNNFQLFPNPVKDVLFVQASGNNENAAIHIIDAAGRKVKELKVFLNATTSFSIDVNYMPSGIYKLVLNKRASQEVQTFIKK